MMSTLPPIGSSSLIASIANLSAKELDCYLRTLPVDKVATELIQCDSRAMMPLHIAIEKGNFDKVKVLLSFDAPVTAKIGNKSTEDYAKDLVVQQPQDERKRVYALIKSRGRWQGMIATDQGIVFSRSMKLIEEAINKIQGAVNKAGVLFLGLTGEGKSTFINYLSGVDYELDKTSTSKRVKALSRELVQTGNSTSSETIFPEVVEVKGEAHVLVDLAGSEDTRGKAEEICSAASICLLNKKLASIQAIPLVCSWSSLADTRMVNYRKAAYNVGAIINQDLKTGENVIFVVTKPAKDLTEDEVRERLQELVQGEGWNGSASLTSVKRENVDEDIWKKYCLRKATEAILSRQENIVIADITSSKARLVFKKALDALEKKSKNFDQFDFKSYSHLLEKFQSVLQHFLHRYIEMGENHCHFLDELAKKEVEMKAKMSEMSKKEKEKTDVEQNILKPFDQKFYLENIQAIQVKQDQLKSKLAADSQSKKTYEAQLSQCQSEIINVEASLVDVSSTPPYALNALCLPNFLNYIPSTPTRHGFSARSTITVDIEQYKTQYPDLFVKARQAYNAFISAASNTHVGTDAAFTAVAQAGASARDALNKLVNDENNWNFLLYELYGVNNTEHSQIIGLLTNAINTLDQALVNFNTAAHAMKARAGDTVKIKRVQDLRNNLQDLERSLANCQQALWATQDEIRQQEILFVQEDQKMKDHQKMYDTQINMHVAKVKDLTKEIAALKDVVSHLQVEQEKISEEISWSKLEVDVNADLASKIHEMIELLGFKDTGCDRFMDLYKIL